MTTIITHRDLKFSIETQGFRNHEADSERAIDAAESMIKRLNIASTFALWAAARHIGKVASLDGRSHPIGDRIHAMEYRAAKAGTKGWHDASDCFVSIGAVDPD